MMEMGPEHDSDADSICPDRVSILLMMEMGPERSGANDGYYLHFCFNPSYDGNGAGTGKKRSRPDGGSGFNPSYDGNGAGTKY